MFKLNSKRLQKFKAGQQINIKRKSIWNNHFSVESDSKKVKLAMRLTASVPGPQDHSYLKNAPKDLQ